MSKKNTFAKSWRELFGMYNQCTVSIDGTMLKGFIFDNRGPVKKLPHEPPKFLIRQCLDLLEQSTVSGTVVK